MALVLDALRRGWGWAVGVGEAGDAGIRWRRATISDPFADGAGGISGAVGVVRALDAASVGAAGAGVLAFEGEAVAVNLALRGGARLRSSVWRAAVVGRLAALARLRFRCFGSAR